MDCVFRYKNLFMKKKKINKSLTALGATLKHQREHLGLSQPDLYKLCGVSIPTIQNIENNRSNPSYRTLSKLCGALKLELSVR